MSDQLINFGSRHRPVEIEPLNIAAANGFQIVKLKLSLNTFCHNIDIQASGEAYYQINYRSILNVDLQVRNELSVDFDSVYGQLTNAVKRGILCAESSIASLTPRA